MLRKLPSLLLLLSCKSADQSAQGACLITDTDIPCVELVSVYDGDTFTVSLGDRVPQIFSRWQVRVRGVDTPEMHGPTSCERRKAAQAQEQVGKLLKAAAHIDLLNVEGDKYYRLLADVEVDGKDLGKEILRRGLGAPYLGGTKTAFKCS